MADSSHFNDETLKALRDANLGERFVKDAQRTLLVSHQQMLLQLFFTYIAAKDPKFLSVLNLVHEQWLHTANERATEISRNLVQNPKVQEHVPSDLQLKLARDYVTTYVGIAREIAERFTRTVAGGVSSPAEAQDVPDAASGEAPARKTRRPANDVETPRVPHGNGPAETRAEPATAGARRRTESD